MDSAVTMEPLLFPASPQWGTLVSSPSGGALFRGDSAAWALQRQLESGGTAKAPQSWSSAEMSNMIGAALLSAHPEAEELQLGPRDPGHERPRELAAPQLDAADSPGAYAQQRLSSSSISSASTRTFASSAEAVVRSPKGGDALMQLFHQFATTGRFGAGNTTPSPLARDWQQQPGTWQSGTHSQLLHRSLSGNLWAPDRLEPDGCTDVGRSPSMALLHSPTAGMLCSSYSPAASSLWQQQREHHQEQPAAHAHPGPSGTHAAHVPLGDRWGTVGATAHGMRRPVTPPSAPPLQQRQARNLEAPLSAESLLPDALSGAVPAVGGGSSSTTALFPEQGWAQLHLQQQPHQLEAMPSLLAWPHVEAAQAPHPSVSALAGHSSGHAQSGHPVYVPMCIDSVCVDGMGAFGAASTADLLPAYHTITHSGSETVVVLPSTVLCHDSRHALQQFAPCAPCPDGSGVEPLGLPSWTSGSLSSGPVAGAAGAPHQQLHSPGTSISAADAALHPQQLHGIQSAAGEEDSGRSGRTQPPHSATPRTAGQQRARRASAGRKRKAAGAAEGDENGLPVQAEVAGAEETPRSSSFRGVTRHRRSGRWEAHIWVKACNRQAYLGGYEEERHAAEAYDVALLKVKGAKAKTNFPHEKYGDLLRVIHNITLEELIMTVRRQSQGFSRGSSAFRGVTAHPSGRWESRIGVPGSKHTYLGLFEEGREAARAYDRALVRLRGPQAATNFGLSEYQQQLAEHHHMLMAAELHDAAAAAIWAAQSGGDFERFIKHGLAAVGVAVAAPALSRAIAQTDATAAVAAALSTGS